MRSQDLPGTLDGSLGEGWTRHAALAAVPGAARWRDAGVVSAEAALSHGEGLPRSESWHIGSCPQS